MLILLECFYPLSSKKQMNFDLNELNLFNLYTWYLYEASSVISRWQSLILGILIFPHSPQCQSLHKKKEEK